MKFTKFNRNLWKLHTFEEVSYDKKNQLFIIYLLDGYQLEFSEVDEVVVFQFITSVEKEKFIENVFLPNYPYIQRNPRVS